MSLAAVSSAFLFLKRTRPSNPAKNVEGDFGKFTIFYANAF